MHEASLAVVSHGLVSPPEAYCRRPCKPCSYVVPKDSWSVASPLADVSAVDRVSVGVGAMRRPKCTVYLRPTRASQQLFACTLAENIAFGADGASREAIEAAAKVANAHAFIAALPDGYSTFVGERGVQLSGGQKQRIAIARAILRDPRVLLLDEATSALDNESERVVQAALEELMAGRTCVVVAHRLSTIRNAHTIAVMRQGELLEQGSHEELAARPGGAYSRLMAVRSE